MHELILVVVPAELAEDPAYDIQGYVYSQSERFDCNNSKLKTEAVACNFCVDGRVSDEAAGLCSHCGGSGESGDYTNPEGRWTGFQIGGRFGVHYLQLQSESAHARLALTTYEDMPASLKGPDCYGAEIASMFVIVDGAIQRWPIPDDMRVPSWYYVICDAHS